jgi:hypothetical protein
MATCRRKWISVQIADGAASMETHRSSEVHGWWHANRRALTADELTSASDIFAPTPNVGAFV